MGKKALPTLGETMRVGELIALLARVDPEEIVVIDPDSNCLRLYDPRPGMYQPVEEQEVSTLTNEDNEFLRALHILR